MDQQTEIDRFHPEKVLEQLDEILISRMTDHTCEAHHSQLSGLQILEAVALTAVQVVALACGVH